ncbi:MAG: response regulator [Acidimicrobiales bacterium]
MALVLAVDDEEDILEIIRVNLELEGHQVALAHDGADALSQIEERRPDLILLDVMMPGLDGWEVLTRLKHSPELAHAADVPVLMLTARVSDEDRIRGGIEGAIRYLTKPFLPAALCHEVNHALDDEPEPVKRRRVQRESLTELARIEKGAAGALPRPSPRATGSERTTLADGPGPSEGEGEGAGNGTLPHVAAMRGRLDELSGKQRQLLETILVTPSVSEAANVLHVSRSNVYASLRRISRRLQAQSVPELLALVRTGELLPPR